MSPNKNAYFQGGGGINEPTPGKKKYKSDKAIVVQPRFKEPFYRNYDLYDAPGVDGKEPKHGPGAGWHSMQKYKSVQEFLAARRKKMKDKYKADDSYIEDTAENFKERANKMKIRAAIFSKIIKTAGPNYDLGQGVYDNMDKYDSIEDFRKNKPKIPGALRDVNHIDFPIDDQIKSDPIPGENSSYSNSVGIGGQLDEYLPQNDFEGKSPDQLDFGRDYTKDSGRNVDFDKLMNKYMNPSEADLMGLPDGIDPNSDLDAENTINTENPYQGITDMGEQMYEDKWNI